MVDNQDKAERRLSRYDHEELRYLRLRGFTAEAIARRLGVSENAVRYRVRTYGLDTPVSVADTVRLELMAAFRETSRRLESEDLIDAERARLCAVQAKQALALLRVLPEEARTEEDEVMTTNGTNRASLDMMDDEDMRDEIRRLVGLETKGVDGRDGKSAAQGGDEAVSGDALSVESSAGPATSD